MYYDKSRLMKIELWIRRLAWGYLVLIVLRILNVTDEFTGLLYQRGLAGYYANNIWTKSYNLSSIIQYVMQPLFLFLMLLGTAKVIRYLLALADEIRAKYSSNTGK